MLLPHRWTNIIPCLCMIRANRSCSFGLYLCVLWDYCIWEITQILYSMHVLCSHICTWYLVTNLLPKFSLTCSTQRLVSVATSIFPLSDPRDHQFSSIHLRVLSLVLGLAQLFELGTKTWMTPRSTRLWLVYWMWAFRFKYTQRHEPASQYIVALFPNCLCWLSGGLPLGLILFAAELGGHLLKQVRNMEASQLLDWPSLRRLLAYLRMKFKFSKAYMLHLILGIAF